MLAAKASVEGVPPASDEIARVVPVLNTLRDLPSGYASREAVVPVHAALRPLSGRRASASAPSLPTGARSLISCSADIAAARGDSTRPGARAAYEALAAT